MRENYFEDGKWWVSPYNFVPEVREGLTLPPKVEIHDATLRDGEPTPGVVFSIDDKIRIATKLDEVGVERIEAGMPAVSPPAILSNASNPASRIDVTVRKSIKTARIRG